MHADPIFAAAIVLMVAALAGEGVFRAFAWPRIIGYSIVGMVTGGDGFGRRHRRARGEQRAVRHRVRHGHGPVAFRGRRPS